MSRIMEYAAKSVFFTVILFSIVDAWMPCFDAEKPDAEQAPVHISGRLPGDDVPAVTACYLPDAAAFIEEEMEAEENRLIQEALLAKSNVIENCTVTWYTNNTCGKKPGDPAYGITSSGMETVDGLTCAVDKEVIPLYSDVFVQFADGTIRQYWATDTGVKGNHIDIYCESYDEAIQNGRQTLTVWWVKE